MKVAPYFCTSQKKKRRKKIQTERRWGMREWQEQRAQSKGNCVFKKKKKKSVWGRMRDRETIWGDGGEGLATATLSYIKKCVAHCSLFASLSLLLSLCLSLSLFLSLPPCPGRSTHSSVTMRGGREGIEGWKEGGRVVLSSSLCLCGASRTKTPTLPLCVCASVNVCVRVCVGSSLRGYQ